jgi:hypothetical protein
MQFIGSDLRNRLSYGIYAVALVCSLVIYKSAGDPKPLSVTPQPSRAIAPEYSNNTTALDSNTYLRLLAEIFFSVPNSKLSGS